MDVNKRHNLSYALLLAVVALLSLTAFELSYKYDNKYTFPRHQSGMGVTILDIKAYEQSPFLYLTDGWELYTGKLLSPDKISGQTPSAYVYIGQYGGFDMGNAKLSPYGRATYRMTVFLDDIPRDYALELNRIYSTYRLWINGELRQYVGMEAIGDAIPSTDGSTVRLRAAGKIEIIVEVEDFKSFYSGMVYPPAFGSPEAVGKMLSTRLIIHTAGAAIASIIGLLCILMLFLGRRKLPYAGLAFMCVCFMGSSAYPALQALSINSSIHQILQQLCYYATFLCVVWLQGKLCKIPKRLYYTISIIAAVVLASVLIRPLISVSTAGELYRYSYMLTSFKWLVSAYLIITGAFSVLRGNPYSKPLLAGFTVFGCALVSDRLHPLFEPILLDWNVQLASFSIIIITAGIFGFDLFYLYREDIALRERQRLDEFRLEAGKHHADLQHNYIMRTRRLLHETRSNLTVMWHYLDEGDNVKLREYLDSLLNTENKAPSYYTDNELINAILSLEFGRAKELAIYTEHEFSGIIPNLNISDNDLASLLMNLLDNAIEACGKIENREDRWLFLRVTYQETIPYLEIECRNSMVASQNGFETSKADKYAHGFGMKIMRQIAEKNGGNLELETSEESFCACVKLFLQESFAY